MKNSRNSRDRRYTMETLENRRLLACDLGHVEFESQLVGSGVEHGEAEFEIECEHGASQIKFSIEVNNADPGSSHDVVVGGISVGSLYVDSRGRGEIEFSNHSDDDELPLPDNFPQISAGTEVQVGSILAGSFGSDDHSDDDSEDGHTESDDDSDTESDDNSDHDSDDGDVLDDRGSDETGDPSDDDSDDDDHLDDHYSDDSDDDFDDESDDDFDDESDDEFGGLLTGDGPETGRFEFEFEHGGWELEVTIRNSEPGTVHDVTVDNAIVGQIHVDDSGYGRLRIENADVVVLDGSTVSVGEILSGSVVNFADSADFNDDGAVDAVDVDVLFAQIASNNFDPEFDLDGDSAVDDNDMATLLNVVMDAVPGDVNFDGVFDSSDLVRIFQAGHYEDGIAKNSSWMAGDWNGDREFDSHDLVHAFQHGHYDSGIAATSVVASAIEDREFVKRNL